MVYVYQFVAELVYLTDSYYWTFKLFLFFLPFSWCHFFPQWV